MKQPIAGIGIALLLAAAPSFAETLQLDRNQCVQKALESNRMLRISEYDVRIGQALLNQAKSAYWPSLKANLLGGIMDEPLVFTYPASSLTTPNINIPANGLFPGSPALALPGQDVDIPEQKVEITDDVLIMGSLNLQYPLYTGGIRKAINQQARFGIEAAEQGLRRAELDVVYDVDRAYYGAVVARQLVKISTTTLERMEATLELTKRLYEEGSGQVKKTDYLRNKTVVEIVRSTTFTMQEKQKKADTALVNLMGLPRATKVVPADQELPAVESMPTCDELIGLALEGNPDLGRVRAGIGAYTAMVQEARGSYKPKIGLFAKYVHIESDLDTGMMDPQNKDFAAIGIGGELPLFEGFRNKNRVLEKTLELEKLKAREAALIEGIAVWVEHAYAEMESAIAREASTGAALQAATENRDLNVRAYQEELVETADVIEAQFFEAFIEARYMQTLYECVETRARLHKLVGSES